MPKYFFRGFHYCILTLGLIFKDITFLSATFNLSHRSKTH